MYRDLKGIKQIAATDNNIHFLYSCFQDHCSIMKYFEQHNKQVQKTNLISFLFCILYVHVIRIPDRKAVYLSVNTYASTFIPLCLDEVARGVLFVILVTTRDALLM